MTRHTADTSARFFEQLYREADDPWNFRHSPYERGRYQAIVKCLGGRRYRRALEPGCAIGELTSMLAPLCDEMKAFDLSASAVTTARLRCREEAHVSIATGSLPADMPEGSFDLIIFSELGYYFTAGELGRVARLLWTALEPGGRFVACHWLGHSDDHRLHGSDVGQVLTQQFGPSDMETQPGEGFLLQHWTRGHQTHGAATDQ